MKHDLLILLFFWEKDYLLEYTPVIWKKLLRIELIKICIQ